MKSINQYIQEKYLIDTETKIENYPTPDKVDFNEFSLWLKKEFNLSQQTFAKFKIDVLLKLDLDVKEFEVENYENVKKESQIETVKNQFKKIVGIDHYKIAEENNIQIYYFSFRSSNGIKLPTIFITDKSKNIMYTFLINIFL